MRKKPLRLVTHFLTMDYVNQAQKMREIEARLKREQSISPMELTAYWVVLGIAVTAILLIVGGKS